MYWERFLTRRFLSLDTRMEICQFRIVRYEHEKLSVDKYRLSELLGNRFNFKCNHMLINNTMF